MRRVSPIIFVSLFAALIALPALPGMRRGYLSTTKRFSIDDKAFSIESSARDDLSLIREELKRKGIDAPHLGISKPTNLFIAEKLRHTGDETHASKPQIPPGLRMEHVVRTDSESSRVELAIGSLECRGSHIRRLLSESGWEFAAPINGQAAVSIINKGKETTIVLLEEKEGKFLLIRKSK